jgi:hypothetical protein
VPSQVGDTVKMCRVRKISRKGQALSGSTAVDRIDGVVDHVEGAWNPQRLYAELVSQTGDGMR